MNTPSGFSDEPVMYHFTLSHAEAGACMRGLERESITAATLRPDYGGIVQSLLDEIS